MGASESKLAFKQGVFLLAGDDDISPDDPLWAQVRAGNDCSNGAISTS